MLAFQRARSKQHHVQAVVVAMFIVSLIVTAVGFYLMVLVQEDCLADLRQATAENATDLLDDLNDNGGEDASDYGVPYGRLPAAASNFDLLNERECSRYIASVGGMAWLSSSSSDPRTNDVTTTTTTTTLVPPSATATAPPPVAPTNPLDAKVRACVRACVHKSMRTIVQA